MSKKIDGIEKEEMMKKIHQALDYFEKNGDPNFMNFFDDDEWRVKNGRSPLSIEDDAS